MPRADERRSRRRSLADEPASLCVTLGTARGESGERASRHSKTGIDLDNDVLPKLPADAAAIVDDALRAALNKTGLKA